MEKEIMYESPEAARKVTMHLDGEQIAEGYLSVQGIYCKDEATARYHSCTHRLCECGNKMQKGYLRCRECIDKVSADSYNKKPFKVWDGLSFVYCEANEKYFSSADDIDDYLADEEFITADSLRLVICDENRYQGITSEYWEDILPEDGDIDKKLEEKLKEFNDFIATLPPASYSPGKFRTAYNPDDVNPSTL